MMSAGLPQTSQTGFTKRAWLVALFLLVFFLFYYAQAALRLPAILTVDTYANDAAIEYLIKHQRLPVVYAEDEEILFTSLGTTRSTRPPLTYIANAALASVFESRISSRTVRQRLGAVLLGALTVVAAYLGFMLAFKHIGYAVVGAWMLALWPQFTLLASSNNDDIGAISATSIVFVAALSVARFNKNLWPWLIAAVGIGLVLQSKFTAWLSLPIFLVYFATYGLDLGKRLLRFGPVLILMIVIAGGWWVIFNMVHYGIADPTGLAHAAELQREIKGYAPSPRGYASTGVSVASLLTNFDGFLSTTFRSSIGYIPWIDLDIGLAAYGFYGVMVAFGFIGLVYRLLTRSNSVFFRVDLAILFAVFIQLMAYVHHNWARDIQPHGRYLLPLIVPVIYLILSQLKSVISRIKTPLGRLQTASVEPIILVVLIISLTLVHAIAVEHYLRF